MSQRNPMNDRYRDTENAPKGKTKKSAASAKPSSKAGSSVYVRDKKDPKAKRQKEKEQHREQQQRIDDQRAQQNHVLTPFPDHR